MQLQLQNIHITAVIVEANAPGYVYHNTVLCPQLSPLTFDLTNRQARANIKQWGPGQHHKDYKYHRLHGFTISFLKDSLPNFLSLNSSVCFLILLNVKGFCVTASTQLGLAVSLRQGESAVERDIFSRRSP